MRTCPRHPDEEATLACAACERPLCWRCARNTQLGTRCPECGGERPPSPPAAGAAPAAALERAYWMALVCAALAAALSRGVFMPFLVIAAMAIVWRAGLSQRRRLLYGGLWYLASWWLAAGALVEVRADGTLAGRLEAVSPLATASLCAALAAVAWVLWRPSLKSGRELLAARRPIAAAVVVAGGIGACAFSLLLALMLALGS